MRPLLTCALCLLPAAALAGPAYLDDRSTPAAVIASLYNAVTLKDYPRAWSYYGPEAEKSFEDFPAGYADTESVDVRTGEPMEEGAAGSVYWSVPTVIRARRTDGTEAVFAGCYILRQSNYQLRELPPYDPIHIVSGKLRPSAQPFENAEGDCEP